MVFGDEAFGRRLGLVEVMRMGPHGGISALRGDTEGLLSLPHEDTRRKQLLQARKQALIKHRICRHLDLGLGCCFVIAALAD